MKSKKRRIIRNPPRRKRAVSHGHARIAAKLSSRHATRKRTSAHADGTRRKSRSTQTEIPMPEQPKGPGHYQFNGAGWSNYSQKQLGLRCSEDCPGCNA